MRDEPCMHTSARAVVASVDAFVPTNTSKTLRLMGYSVRETTGAAAASARLVDSATAAAAVAADDLAYPVMGAANGKDGAWYGPNGILAEKGISLIFIAGSFDIDVYWRAG
jgi:hypothetical protein